MTYTYISQTEPYQIQAHMKARQNQIEITRILGRHKPTISRELARGSGRRRYRPRRVQKRYEERSQGSRNAARFSPEIWCSVEAFLGLQLSPERIASQLPISQKTIYLQIYADKAMGGHLWRSLRCQKQKRKRYAGGHNRRGQILDRRSITERPESIERRAHVGHWEGDTVIGAAHQHAIVTLVEKKAATQWLPKFIERLPSKLVPPLSNDLHRSLRGLR
jgi:IS30 family transposase